MCIVCIVCVYVCVYLIVFGYYTMNIHVIMIFIDYGRGHTAGICCGRDIVTFETQ